MAGRLGAAARSARETGVRSAQVLTGADIRRFEEFTEAATTAVVGVHRDQAELRERLTEAEESILGVNQREAELRERLAQIEQSLAEAHRGQAQLVERLDAMEESMRAQGGPKMLVLVSLGMSAVALVLGIVAVIVGVL